MQKKCIKLQHRYRIKQISKDCNGSLRSRFIAMGLTPKQEFKICCVAPFGGPVKIDVKGTSLFMRQKELDLLITEVLT